VASLPGELDAAPLGLEVKACGTLAEVADPQAIEAAVRLGGQPLTLAPNEPGRWLRLEGMRLIGTSQLAQERSPEARRAVLEALWARGLPEDPRAVDLVGRASPDTPVPPFLAAPEGIRLCCAMEPSDEQEAVALLAETWPIDLAPGAWGEAHRHSSAWVGARDEEGALVATARAVSDWMRDAWIYDVMVAPAWRGRGVGEAIVRLLLDHPALRQVRRIQLRSAQRAQALYARFGFEPVGPPSPSGVVEMLHTR
jgi:GNAT superfamily N-acetyltransferase